MRDFTVIAHRGAPGYLPEHTLEGVAMAHAMGPDYIEQDVVLTRDNALIVLHDLYLDAVTDVALQFPGRSRENGQHYAIDFSLEEIRTLRVHERIRPDGRPEFPGRFPHEDSLFRIPTLEEEITLIQGLNRSSGRNVGLYIEPKSPAWHSAEGHDLVNTVIEIIAQFGYRRSEDKACLQSFDLEYLKRARNILNTDLRLVQLIGENSWLESESDFDYLRSDNGLREIARVADGIGPWLPQIVRVDEGHAPDISDLAERARRHGLFVHAYTLRADQLPPAVGGMRQAVHLLKDRAGLDGVFTDHPDQVIDAIRNPGQD